MEQVNYYKELGVAPKSTPKEIKDAYHALAKRYHPDRNAGDAAVLEKFQRINEAYEVLSDPTQRAQYDRLGAFYQLEQSVPTPEELGSFVSETIGNIFRGHHRNRPGSDITHTLNLDLSEVLGGNKTITILREVQCVPCGGQGAADSDSMVTCTECDGKGKRSRFFRNPCARCDGRGYLITKRCRQCAGIGLVDRSDDITFHIPPGIQAGQLIQISSKGNASTGNKSNGNLILVVQIKDHPHLERRGRDLYCEVPLLWNEAILGTSLKIPTLQGSTNIQIPPNTHTHQLFRLKGKGLPDAGIEDRGDLHIRVIVELPQALSRQQQDLVRSLANDLAPEQTPRRNEMWPTSSES